MGIEVTTVTGRRELKRFVTYPIGLLGRNPGYVPPLVGDDMSTFSADKNPAFEHAEARFFLARREQEAFEAAWAVSPQLAPIFAARSSLSA